MRDTRVSISESEWRQLEEMTEGYSGSDISNIVADALLQPVRELETASYWKQTGSQYATLASIHTLPPSYPIAVHACTVHSPHPQH